MKCPTCKAAVVKSAGDKRLFPFWPFCSERCQLVDLGRWLGEEYRIPAEPAGEGDGSIKTEDE